MKEFQLVDKSDISSPKKGFRVYDKKNKYNYNNNVQNNKQIDIMELNKKSQINDLEKFEEKYLEIRNNKCYNNLNKLMYSRTCIIYYIIIIIISIFIFAYSLLSFFINLSKKKFF